MAGGGLLWRKPKQKKVKSEGGGRDDGVNTKEEMDGMGLPMTFGSRKELWGVGERRNEGATVQEVEKGKGENDADDGDGAKDEGEDDAGDDDLDEWHLPLSQQAALQPHAKAVTCVSVEHSGTRLASGSADGGVHMYDFQGMKRDLKAFRTLAPLGSYGIRALSWSPSGERLLVVGQSACPKVLDRDGREEGECPRGDMYIRDMKNTKGHTTGCTGGQWNPVHRHRFLTSSEDGTLRVWDTESFTTAQQSVLKPTQTRPGRMAVMSCCWSVDGRMVAGGLKDGTIQLWDAGGKSSSGSSLRSAAIGVVLPPKEQMIQQQKWSFAAGAKTIIKKAHDPDEDITGLCMSVDGVSLVSRSMDNTLKLWDIRKHREPVKAIYDLPCALEETSVCFSPDGGLIVTGISAHEKDARGAVVFINKENLEIVRRVGFPCGIAGCAWNPRINQIFAACSSRSGGHAAVLYDPDLSNKGAINCVGKAPRAPDPFDFTSSANLVIQTPHALPMFRDEGGRKRVREKLLKDPLSTKKPQMPLVGRGQGGRAGGSELSNLATHLVKKRRGDVVNEDDRAAILRFADKPAVFTAAYLESQPVTILQEEEKNEEES